MPTTRRSAAPTGLTIPTEIMKRLRWSARTPLDVQCAVAWTDTPDGHVAQCLTFTITAVRQAGTRRQSRKAA